MRGFLLAWQTHHCMMPDASCSIQQGSGREGTVKARRFSVVMPGSSAPLYTCTWRGLPARALGPAVVSGPAWKPATPARMHVLSARGVERHMRNHSSLEAACLSTGFLVGMFPAPLTATEALRTALEDLKRRALAITARKGDDAKSCQAVQAGSGCHADTCRRLQTADFSRNQ